MNTILNSTKLSNTDAKALDATTLSINQPPMQGGLGQTQIEVEEEMDEEELEALRRSRKSTIIDVQKGIKSHATKIDLT